jgi:predicted GNAT superfamily acetyltransferase
MKKNTKDYMYDWKKEKIESVKALFNDGLIIFEGNKEKAKNYVCENSCANKSIIEEYTK